MLVHERRERRLDRLRVEPDEAPKHVEQRLLGLGVNEMLQVGLVVDLQDELRQRLEVLVARRASRRGCAAASGRS